MSKIEGCASPSEQNLLLGAHMSTTGGLEQALYRGASIGCTTVQLFSRNNRQWGTSPLDEKAIAAFEEARRATGINAIVVHASYLINIASQDEALRKRSLAALITEVERCELLSIPFLVLHPGSAVDQTKEAALQNISKSLAALCENIPFRNTTILLENMAGQGSSVGENWEQLALIRDHSGASERIGFCIDLCHAFAAGYNFSSKATYDAFWKECRAALGQDAPSVIHVNDSLKERGSRVDRHADIGKGKIGLEAFRLLMQDPSLAATPKILETPYTTLDDHRKNLDLLVALATEAKAP